MIVGYTGLVGHGKTMLAVQESIRLARLRGAYLASNIWIDCPDLDFVRLSVGDDGLEGLPDLLQRARDEQRGVVIFVDEIGIVLPARFWMQGMSIQLMWAVSQSRKLGADLVFTCQHIAQLDAFLRRITDWIWKVRAVPHPSLARRVAGKRPWLFLASRWRPADVDKVEDADRRLGRSIIRYRRAWEVVYDTDELVTPPEHLARRGGRPSGRRESSRSSGPITETGAGATDPRSPTEGGMVQPRRGHHPEGEGNPSAGVVFAADRGAPGLH